MLRVDGASRLRLFNRTPDEQTDDGKTKRSSMKIQKVTLSIIVAGIALLCALLFFTDLRRNARAADHADAPAVAHDAGADLADAYLFLDPNNTNNVIMIMTVHGFVAPQENVNLGYFDPDAI